MQVLVRLLLPREDKRVYNLKVSPFVRSCAVILLSAVGHAVGVCLCVQEKQIVKVLAPLLGTPISDMRRDVEQGCVDFAVVLL